MSHGEGGDLKGSGIYRVDGDLGVQNRIKLWWMLKRNTRFFPESITFLTYGIRI